MSSKPKPNENCRFCSCSFKIKFGNYISSENLYRPSKRSDCFGTILADICEGFGVKLLRDNNHSDRVCNPCARKVRNLGQLYDFISKHANYPKTPEKPKDTGTLNKRQLDTPDKASPSWRKSKKAKVGKSPQAKKSLIMNNNNDLSTQNKKEDELDTHLNIDDLPKEGLQVKVLARMPNGKVIVRIPREDETKNLVKQIAFGNWKAAANACFVHREMLTELNVAMRKKISREFDDYVKSGSLLALCEPDELAGFSNKVFMEEVRIFCPLWYEAVLGASNLKRDDLKQHGNSTNAAALATASLAKVRNSTLSACHYRISTILFHSGARYEDLIRLNRLGICMSPDSVIRIQRKMGNLLENKICIWKKEIEENRGAVLLCEEIKEKQIPVESQDDLDLRRDHLQHYSKFTEDSYALLMKIVCDEKEKRNEEAYTPECLENALSVLETTKLPLYKIVGDNVDHEVHARVQTSNNKNHSIHWTHQYSILDKVQDPNLERKTSQKPTSSIQFIELLPDQQVQAHLLKNFAILVSRVITKYLKHFQPLSNAVIRHVPHKFEKEMATKSNICTLGMEFLNPNISGDMAQILIHNQEKHVPCLNQGDDEKSKTLLATVPLHGDQLFEERSRNVIWSYQDGLSPYERFESIDTEFADWHAKYTLYKLEYKLFVNHSSASEVGTTRASINRSGKTNAAKGVEKHYNEYSEFHAREIEAHVCASFMEMTCMENPEAHPNLMLPDSTVSLETKARWLLDVCEDFVNKFVFDTDEINQLVVQTRELEEAHKKTRWECREEGCSANYAYHSGRVRHETQAHNLSFDNGNDIRDAFGYYYCRTRCGEVFKTPTTRNRHEKQQHGQKLPPDDLHESSPKDEKKQDYCFNYHSSKLTIGLILFEFNDTIKEGDGQRLFNLYKLVLLLYKTHGHYKYAYAVLLYIVKCVAILPASQALSLKWNRFYNKSGARGGNIPLDLKKEQQNRVLKTMWRALGANLDEKNAERTAGALECVEMIYESVDKDCVKGNQSKNRASSGEEEAVNLILKDLTENQVFKKIPGREYPSFPKFERSLLHGLDYRDLHGWIKEHVNLWGTLYEKQYSQ